MYSLRRTLGVRFSVTMFAALMLIGMGAFFGVRRNLSRLTDQSLVSALELSSDVLARGLFVAPHTQATDVATFVDQVNRFVVVRDTLGRALASNTVLTAGLPFDSLAFRRAVGGERAWSTGRWGHGRVRSLYDRTPPGSHMGFAVVQVAASLDPLATRSRAVLLFILGIVALATVMTAVGAGWLAKSAVAPVADITEHATAIHPGTRGKRISAHADTVEFHGLVSVLNSMLERLDRALAAQRRIISDVGHELRTPITAMQGHLEIALRGPRTSEQYREILEGALEEVEHLSAIDETLLLLARLDAGEHSTSPMPLHACELVARAVDRARESDPSHSFEFAPDCNAPMIPADSKLFRILVDQLLDNAIKHTPPGTRVRATVTCNEAQFMLAIEDDGPGLPDELLPHLFDRFWQADRARTRSSSGPGLGLSIAAAVAEAHDGSVEATRSEMGGLQITVRLPLAAGTLIRTQEVEPLTA